MFFNQLKLFAQTLITVRAIFNQELTIFERTPSEQVWDVGVIYGRIAKSKYGFASISAGLRIVGGVKRGGIFRLRSG